MSYKWIVVEKMRRGAKQLIDEVFETRGDAELALRNLKDPSKARIKRITDSAEAGDATTYNDIDAAGAVRSIGRTPACNNCWWNLLIQFPRDDGNHQAALIACEYCTKETPRGRGKKRLPAFSNFNPITNLRIYKWTVEVLQAIREKVTGKRKTYIPKPTPKPSKVSSDDSLLLDVFEKSKEELIKEL